MASGILFSVLTTVYNGAQYVSETIESVLSQGLGDFEYVIVNDGSTDDTESILSHYASIDSRIRVITKTNEGVASARNTGLRSARGEYLLTIDSDDLCLPGRFKNQYELMEARKDVVVCGSLMKIFGNNFVSTSSQATDNDSIRATMLFRPSIANSTSCVRMSYIRKNDILYNDSFVCAEDFDFWARIANDDSALFCNIGFPLVAYRVHQESLTQSKRQAMHNFASIVRKSQLLRIGLEASNQEIELHSLISDEESIGDREQLYSVGEWLHRILRGNAEHKVFAQSVLTKTVSRKFCKSYANSSITGPVAAWKFVSARHFYRTISMRNSLLIMKKLFGI